MHSLLLITQILVVAACVVAWLRNRRRGPAIPLLGASVLVTAINNLTEGQFGDSMRVALSLASIVLSGLAAVYLVTARRQEDRPADPAG